VPSLPVAGLKAPAPLLGFDLVENSVSP